MAIPRKTDAWGRTVFQPGGAVEVLYSGLLLENVNIEVDQSIVERDKWYDYFDLPDAKTKPMVELSLDDAIALHAERQSNWKLPDWIKDCDVRQVLHGLCSSPEGHARVDHEMDMFEAREMLDLIRCLMALVAHWREHGIVWGVGRGSSVSSYCLFLLDIHRVDSILYGLEIEEFLR